MEKAEKAQGETVVIDAPLLIETGLDKFVDIVVVVTADHGTQIERARSRGITEDEARNIIEVQMSLSEKLRSADYTIDNNADKETTKEGVSS